MTEDLRHELDELRRVVADQQRRLHEQAAQLRALTATSSRRGADGEHRPDAPAGSAGSEGSGGAPGAATRRDLLRLAGAGAAGAVGAAVAGARPAAAITGDPLIAGQTEDAQTPTQLVYDGPLLVTGGAFMAGAGPAPTPPSTAGVVGYVTNANAQWGVHGTSANIAGGGVLGTAPAAGAGVAGRSTSGPDLLAGGTGFVRLASAGHTIPSVVPQAGDLFRMEDNELFYTIATGPPAQIVNLVGSVGGLVFLDTPVRVVDTRLGAGTKLQANAARGFSVQSTTAGDPAVPEGSRAAMMTVTVDATEGQGGFLTVWAADQPRPFISSINWFAPNQILANTTMTRVVRPSGAFNVYAGVNRTHVIIDVIAYYH